MRFFNSFLLFILWPQLLTAQEVTSAEAYKDETLTSCQANFIKHGCDRFIRNQSKDIQKMVNKCDGHQPTYGDIAYACGAHAGGVWKEALESIPEAAQSLVQGLAKKSAHDHLMTLGSAIHKNLRKKIKPKVAIYNWRVNCKKSISCLSKLIQASEPQPLPKKELEKRAHKVMKSWRSWQMFNYYYDKAALRNGLGRNRDPWFTSEMDRVFERGKKKNKNQNAALMDFFYKKWDKLHCLNSDGQSAMICYGLATLVDPLIAAKILKVAKLAKLKESLEKARVRKKPQRPPVRSQEELVKALKDPNDNVFAEAMTSLKTQEQQLNFIEKLSDKDLMAFAKRTQSNFLFIEPWIKAGHVDRVRKLITDDMEQLKSAFETQALSYFARQNRLAQIGLPKGKIKASKNGGVGPPGLEFYDKKGRSRGYITYEYRKDIDGLYIETRGVHSVEDAGRGIQGALFKELLQRHPKTKMVSSFYVKSNRIVVDRALSMGLSCVEAIKKTPAYRIAAKHGFKKIIRADCRTGDDFTKATFGR